MFSKLLRKVFGRNEKQNPMPSNLYARTPALGDIDEWELIPIDRVEYLNPVVNQSEECNMVYQDVDILLNDTAIETVETLPQREMSPVIQDILILYVLAPQNQQFLGYELLQALLAVGLRYGPKRIFHRYEDNSHKGAILFSLASATEPGIFDIENMGAFACTGLCLFTSLLECPDPQVTWKTMLETAKQLADDLGGSIFDAGHKPLTEAIIAQIEKILHTQYAGACTA